MNTIEDLREWAGVTGVDQDGTLRLIEAGVVAFIEQGANRLYRCPPERVKQILNGPEVRSRTLTREAGPQQWVTLAEPPYTILTGTFSVTAGSTAVVGLESKATEELSASPPTAIVFDDDQVLLVSEIQDDLNFTLTEPHDEGVSAVSATADLIGIETRSEGVSDWDELDPRDGFEVDGRRVYSLSFDFPTGGGSSSGSLSLGSSASRSGSRGGRRTVRITYRRGFEEGEGPADATLLVLEMVKSVFLGKRRRSTSVGVPGAFRITWASFKDQAAAFQAKIEALRRPLSFAGGC